MAKESLKDEVRNKYAAVARSGLSTAHDGVRAVAEAFGYSPEELASLPPEANMGLSCGNPTATANLRPGEVVVDLGCGGGIDVLLAARKVGPEGKAIGIDMTPEMIERARLNAQRAGVENAEFHLATMEAMPLADASVDCLISNCVINLAEDKRAVFREMFRVLKPGGRVAVSDIALKQDLPAELRESVAAFVGCIAGALRIPEYERLLAEAGFVGIQVIDTGKDLNAYAKVENQSVCCSPVMNESNPSEGSLTLTVSEASEPRSECCRPSPAAVESEYHARLKALLEQYDANDYAASVRVFAIKPPVVAH
jgi:arsenite methyltransferase